MTNDLVEKNLKEMRNMTEVEEVRPSLRPNANNQPKTTAVAEVGPSEVGPSLSEIMAKKFNVTPAFLMKCLKDTVFKQKDGAPPITDEQMFMLLHVANKYNLDPIMKQLYAFPSKNGIEPFVGIDGWATMINREPLYDGMEFKESEKTIKVDGANGEAPEWIECSIYKKGQSRPTTIKERLTESYKPPFKKGDYISKGPWQTHTSRMLRHKSIIQCARIAFGISIADEDEARVASEFDGAIIADSSTKTQDLNKKLSLMASDKGSKTDE